MAEPSKPAGWILLALLWTAWLVLLGLWTVGLLIPDPHGTLGTAEVIDSWKFIIAKLSHLGVYALLAGLAWRLPVTFRVRIGLFILLLCHGVATEFLQQFVPTRTASLRDVGIDWAGTGLGALVSWKWAR